MQDVAERLLMQFELPDNVAEQKVEVRVQLVESAAELVEPKLDAAREVRRIKAHRRAQTAKTEFERELVVPLAQPYVN